VEGHTFRCCAFLNFTVTSISHLAVQFPAKSISEAGSKNQYEDTDDIRVARIFSGHGRSQDFVYGGALFPKKKLTTFFLAPRPRKTILKLLNQPLRPSNLQKKCPKN